MRKTIHKEVLGYGDEREARSPQDCRRTYASLEYLSGTDIYTLRNQLGHSTIAQTEEYIKDIVDASERQGRLKGCGLLLPEDSHSDDPKPVLFASVRNEGKKNEAREPLILKLLT